MNTIKKIHIRGCAVLLLIALCVSLAPYSAYAAGEEYPVEIQIIDSHTAVFKLTDPQLQSEYPHYDSAVEDYVPLYQWSIYVTDMETDNLIILDFGITNNPHAQAKTVEISNYLSDYGGGFFIEPSFEESVRMGSHECEIFQYDKTFVFYLSIPTEFAFDLNSAYYNVRVIKASENIDYSYSIDAGDSNVGTTDLGIPNDMRPIEYDLDIDVRSSLKAVISLTDPELADKLQSNQMISDWYVYFGNQRVTAHFEPDSSGQISSRLEYGGTYDNRDNYQRLVDYPGETRRAVKRFSVEGNTLIWEIDAPPGYEFDFTRFTEYGVLVQSSDHGGYIEDEPQWFSQAEVADDRNYGQAFEIITRTYWNQEVERTYGITHDVAEQLYFSLPESYVLAERVISTVDFFNKPLQGVQTLLASCGDNGNIERVVYKFEAESREMLSTAISFLADMEIDDYELARIVMVDGQNTTNDKQYIAYFFYNEYYMSQLSNTGNLQKDDFAAWLQEDTRLGAYSIIGH